MSLGNPPTFNVVSQYLHGCLLMYLMATAALHSLSPHMYSHTQTLSPHVSLFVADISTKQQWNHVKNSWEFFHGSVSAWVTAAIHDVHTSLNPKGIISGGRSMKMLSQLAMMTRNDLLVIIH